MVSILLWISWSWGDRYLSPGNHGLIGYNDCQVAGGINFFNSFRHTVDQFEIIGIPQESNILINGTVPVQEDSFLLVFQVLCLDGAFFVVLHNRIEPLRGAHILDILRGIVAEHFSGSGQGFQQLPVQVDFDGSPVGILFPTWLPSTASSTLGEITCRPALTRFL